MKYTNTITNIDKLKCQKNKCLCPRQVIPVTDRTLKLVPYCYITHILILKSTEHGSFCFCPCLLQKQEACVNLATDVCLSWPKLLNFVTV